MVADDTAAPLQQLIQQAPAPSKVGILSAIPQMYGRVSDKAAAARAVQEALKAEIANPSTGAAAWITVGRMRLAAGDQPGSLESLAKAQAIDPAYEGLARLALELLDEGRNEAKPFVTHFLQQQPAPEIRMLYARVLLAQSQFTEASDQLHRVTQDKPDMAEAWLVLASLQVQDQKLALAAESLRKFMDIAQATGDTEINQRIMTQAYVLAAQIAEKQGDLKAAQGWLDRIESPNDSFSVQRQRASILAKQGRMNEARALLKELPGSNAEEQRMKLLAEVQLLKEHNQVLHATKCAHHLPSDIQAIMHADLKCLNCHIVHAVLHAKATWYANACSKSANKSSISSTPTLRRNKLSVTPTFSRSSFGIDPCVMVVG